MIKRKKKETYFPGVVIFGVGGGSGKAGGSGRRLGQEDDGLMNGIRALLKKAPESSLGPLTV